MKEITLTESVLQKSSMSSDEDLLTAIKQIKEADEEMESLLHHTYPPNVGRLSNSRNKDGHSPTLQQKKSPISPHNPVPAPTLFSRNTYPLSLPTLDQYLSSLSPPLLGDTNGDMFPPFDILAKTGHSLEDLESNSTIAPVWKNRALLLNSFLNALIGLLGSSALASFYSLQSLINTVQIFALILSTIVPIGQNIQNIENKWRQLFLGTIPNMLALNFAPAAIQSLLFLFVLMVISSFLLFYFYRTTVQCDRYNSIEGLQQLETKGHQWGIVIVIFLLTILYLPISTMSVHVLVWSQELWPIPNPYVNSTVFPPVVPPLGPASEYRDPLDFCWTTTMKRNDVNFAPIAIALSGIIFFIFAFWFPVALRNAIRRSIPHVDKFTELGRRRNIVDLDGEYHRLLDRDQNPFAFLYNGLHRGWSTYFSNYLFAKLTTLLLVAVIDPDNCLFRSLPRSTISICICGPFLDPVYNASEWISRMNYLLVSATALAIALNTPGHAILGTYVLYSIYGITYGLSLYFSVINIDWSQRIVKRLGRRTDFSLDIFSPRLDVSASSIHTKRRIWQESITALMLTNEDCRIPRTQAMAFAQSRNSQFPPYLLDFKGSPGERHVENIKILREVGSGSYHRAVVLTSGPDFSWYRHLEDVIQKNYIGPDSYWKPLNRSAECKSHFGNSWWIPFPPTLVIRYDDGPCAVLNASSDLEKYIAQNSNPDTQRRRYIRISLRALDGRIVRWPFEHVENVGSSSNWRCGRRYNAVTSKHYEYASLSIQRRGHLIWQGLPIGSGFMVNLRYSRDVQVPGEVFGLDEDYDLTPALARFLQINRDLIEEGFFLVEKILSHYRRHHRKECRWKSRVLTYRFMTFVFDRPVSPDGIAISSIECERDPRMKRLMLDHSAVFKSAYGRLAAVARSEAATWWYIFWDDLWRRNYDTIPGMQKYAVDFNPHYRTSIAYTPLPRPALESFLTQRGMFHKKARWDDFFHTGFLNKLYLRLNDTVFRDSRQALTFHLGDDTREMDMEDIDLLTQAQSSTLGTGGGTDYDDTWIQMRPAYRWEGMLTDPPRKNDNKTHRKFLAKMGAWMGVSPVWRSGYLTNGILLDVRVENGYYVSDNNWISHSALS